jgi:hypothetical protein
MINPIWPFDLRKSNHGNFISYTLKNPERTGFISVDKDTTFAKLAKTMR